MTNTFHKIDTEKWTKEIKEYEHKRKNLEWGENKKPALITAKKVKEAENFYNPILQKYKDKEVEEQVKKTEKKNMINNLAKTKDNQMRIEQTYNLINLKDKLREFKHDPNYPREKSQRIRNNVEGTNVKYNILSNENFAKHHFDKPEKRPQVDNDSEPEPKFSNMPINSYRDYDLLSNKYKENHEEKLKLDKEIHKLHAAKKYWESNKYNPILTKFNDPEMEGEFQKKLKNENDIVASKSRKVTNRNGRGFRDVSLYNPINMAILEKEGCALADAKEHNKIKRYELRDKIEKHYYFQDIQHEMKDKAVLDNKYSYQRYNVVEDRGFDIITLDNIHKGQKENKNLKHNKSEWEKICENSKGDLKANLTVNSEGNLPSKRNGFNTASATRDMSNFYTTSFKDSYRKPEVKPLAPYAGGTVNQFSQSSRENSLNNVKIDKNAWFNSSKKKDFCFNDTQNQIINTFNNRNVSTTIPMKTRSNIFGDLES